MKICHVVTSLEIGGMERVVCDLLATAGGNGHSGFLFCTDLRGALFESARAGAKECGARRPRRLVVDWRVVRRLVRFARSTKIDLFHAHNHVAHLYAVLASLVTRVPVVLTLHGQGYLDTRRTLWLRRCLSTRTRRIVAVSRDSRAIIEGSRAVPSSLLTWIPNGVDTVRFTPCADPDDARARIGLPKAALIIGSVGRLSVEKNYRLMVDAYASVQSRLPGSRLVIVGDGPERSRLESHIRERGLGDACVLPGASTEVVSWLQSMDVFCLSSDTEGTSMTLLEAGASGLPCVVTDAGGNREIVADGETGLVVPRGSVDALGDAMARLGEDVLLRKTMGANARRSIEERYSLTAMADQYDRVYREAVK